MERQSSNIIGIKIGTDTITENGGLSDKVMRQVASDIHTLLERGKSVFLVSSGAVGSAKGTFPKEIAEQIADMKQALSSIGQTNLVDDWKRHFSIYSVYCSQFPLQENDFLNGRSSRLQKTFSDLQKISELSKRKYVPIVNGADVAGFESTDNDSIAKGISDALGAESLVFLTDVEGLYVDPKIDSPEVIREVSVTRDDIYSMVTFGKPSEGGSADGMEGKVRAAVELANAGTEVIITNGKKKNAILHALEHEVGTWFHR